MNYPAGIRPLKIKEFSNAHVNFIQPLDEDQSFDVHLQDEAWGQMSGLQQYNACTSNFQWIIKRALEKQLSVRAIGSGWSLSKVAMSDDAIIHTKRCRHKFNLSEENFAPAYLAQGHRAEDYRFLQCGNTIIDISRYLEEESNPPKCLRVSGGSNGQTIVGAFSTNTHGAAIGYGSLPDMIVGMHIITGPDRHIYVERASRKITSAAFHEKIGAEVVHDDELFNAALVSFGSFGIIHGVLVEVEDKFLLEQKLRRVPYDDRLDDAVTNNNYDAISDYLRYSADDRAHPLYHFELAINPHDFAFNDPEKGAYLRGMHKVPYRSDYNRIDAPGQGYTYGDDTLGFMQTVLDKASVGGFLSRGLIPKLVNSLFDLAYDRPDDAVGTIGETFRNTVFRGKLFSAALGVDRKNVRRVIDISLEVNKRIKLAGVLAMRFVKGTRATLGFTKWENTCVVELDGVDARINHNFVKELGRRLQAEGIIYTLHWGKINRLLTGPLLEWMYGEEALTDWKKQRSRVMTREVQHLFNNEFMERCDLDEYVPYTVPHLA
ncbi:FAD-binding protein [Roseivirga sp. BDSF3-8]|uniref:FAD-binding protein n=1 Tax=Roseivirga sp. BDSF3-8 TaxID=3241598 RepID=UPI003531AEC8